MQLFGVAWSLCCLAHAVVPSQCDTVATPRPDWLEGSALSGLTGPGRVPVATSSRWQSLLHPLGGKTAGAVTAIGCGAVATESGGAPWQAALQRGQVVTKLGSDLRERRSAPTPMVTTRRWSCITLSRALGPPTRGGVGAPRHGLASTRPTPSPGMTLLVMASGGSQREPSPPRSRAALTWRGGSVPRGL